MVVEMNDSKSPKLPMQYLFIFKNIITLLTFTNAKLNKINDSIKEYSFFSSTFYRGC